MRRSLALSRRALRPGALLAALGIVTGVIVSTPAFAASGPIDGAGGSAPRVVVVSDSDNGDEADNLTTTLASIGADAERVHDLPEDLGAYDQVWIVEAYDGLSDDEEAAVSAYIDGGGAAYLTGERPCCEALNQSMQTILRFVTGDRDITVGGQGDINGPFTFNPNAADSVTLSPNALLDFVPDSPGALAGIGGIADRNTFASNGTVAVGGVWDESDLEAGTGRVAMLMDIDWLANETRLPILQNIYTFLSRGQACSNDGSAVGVHWEEALTWSTPNNCDVLIAPLRVQWFGTLDQPGATFASSAVGVNAACSGTTAGIEFSLTCDLSGAATTGGRLSVTVNTASGDSTRNYRVTPKNDPRNVPASLDEGSDWWTWPDADDDGLPDKWETDGVWVDGVYVDLPALGARPQHKDLFIHADIEQGMNESYTSAVFDEVVESFRLSPVTNPDGTTGITMHVERGSAVPTVVMGDIVTWSDIQRPISYSGVASQGKVGGAGVPPIFKYIVGDDQDYPDDAEGLLNGKARDLPDSFIVLYLNDDQFDIINGWTGGENGFFDGSESARVHSLAVNMMHEIGHTINLHHHGAGDLPNDDPAYRSVMSYAYNLMGAPSPRGRFTADYSQVNSVNYDWKMGPAAGSLVLIDGQDGTNPDAYYYSVNSDLGESEPIAPETQTISDITQAVLPDDYEAYAEKFGFEPSEGIFPIVFDPITEIEVGAGTAAILSVDASIESDSELSLIISSPPEHGTLTTEGLTLTYTADEGFTGVDIFSYRATTGYLASAPVTVTAAIQAKPAPHPSDSASPSPSATTTASPSPSATTTASPSPSSGTTPIPAEYSGKLPTTGLANPVLPTFGVALMLMLTGAWVIFTLRARRRS